MTSPKFARLTAFVALLGLSTPFALAAPAASDPCAKIAGQAFAAPADALACMKSFPFNETLRQNVLTAVSRVFDFYTFEDYYLNSPPPFQESTINIRAEIARMNTTHYAVSGYMRLDWEVFGVFMEHAPHTDGLRLQPRFVHLDEPAQ